MKFLILLTLLPLATAIVDGFETVCMEFPVLRNAPYYMDKCSAFCGFSFVMDAKTWSLADISSKTVAKANFPPLSSLRKEFIRFAQSNVTTKHKTDRKFLRKLPKVNPPGILMKIYVTRMQESSNDGYHVHRGMIQSFLKNYSESHQISSVVVIPVGNQKVSMTHVAKFLKYLKVVTDFAKLDLYQVVMETTKSLDNATVQQIDQRTHGLILHTVGLSKNNATSFDSPLGGKFPRTIKSIIKTWVGHGYPSSKMFGSVDFYSKSYKLNNATEDAGLQLPAKKVARGGYINFCNITKTFDWTYHKEATSYFGHKNLNWLNMETVNTLEKKVSFMMKQKLRGVAIWGINRDSDENKPCPAGKFALMETVQSTMKGDSDKLKELRKNENLKQKKIISSKNT